MASRHVRWVLTHRDHYTDEIDRDIMVAIASHIGYDDRPATMSIATIAKLAGCHYNTADRRTKALAETGGLVIEKDGRYLTYNLPDSADDHGKPGDEPPPGHKPKPDGPDADALQDTVDDLKDEIRALREDVKELGAIVTSLSHHLHTSVTSPSHHLHTSVTSDQRGDVNKEGKKLSSEEKKDIDIGGRVRGGFAEGVDVGAEDKDPAFVAKRTEILSAITMVVRETYVPERNGDDFEGVAAAFVRQGITSQQVIDFGDWWTENGGYAGAPALTSLQNNIKNSIAGVKARASPNGTSEKESEFLPKGHKIEQAVGTDW